MCLLQASLSIKAVNILGIRMVITNAVIRSKKNDTVTKIHHLLTKPSLFRKTLSLQRMVDLDKILGAPTVPQLRCGCAKSVPKS